MTALRVETTIPFDNLLQSLPQLNERELDLLAQQTAYVRAKTRANHADSAESDLLMQIAQCHIADASKIRLAALTMQQQEEGKLSYDDQQALNALIDEMEIINAKRLRYLIALANLRQITLDQLMADLELTPLSAV